MKLFNWLFPPTIKSEINGKIRISERFGNKAIIVGGVTQSGGELIQMWDFVVSDLKKQNKNVKNCLVLGVGAGTVIDILQKKLPNLKITAIELDSVMIEIAKKEFALQTNNLKIVNADAILWCKKNTGKKFDCIIVDLYIGRFNPPEIRMHKFLQILSKLITKNGIIYYNTHYHKKRQKEFEEFFKICRDVFTEIETIYTFPYNKILLLSGKKLKQPKK